MKRGDLVRFSYPVPSKVQDDYEELYGIVVGSSSVICHKGGKFKNVIWFGKPRIRPIKTDYLEVISESR